MNLPKQQTTPWPIGNVNVLKMQNSCTPEAWLLFFFPFATVPASSNVFLVKKMVNATSLTSTTWLKYLPLFHVLPAMQVQANASKRSPNLSTTLTDEMNNLNAV